ncbi:K+-transporting ATPase ATPase C chain [Silvibacterium bohemicum]|uniref:Potassium-transporting ATPase KdpC subunit n=1 Tax=Silvibacterium bohemicum TaxID=1577686 RepID=A0A841JX77_9BACT|nr:potassium-transporting ATPase subunit KdpC [Silvibacterium bohemicum]MBB6145165.1 K+-transporting ATPase ATPase C chain [Silvibacterium bohemicum]
MTSNLKIAIRFTLITTVLLGIIYPLLVTAFAHLTMPSKADGQLIVRDGKVIGSEIIGQNFTGDTYFHSRPSAAGNGYDAANSSGSNYAQSNKKLVDRIQGDVATYQKTEPGKPVPIDLVTTSGSGLDPDISPAAALYQVHRVAMARHLSDASVETLVQTHMQGRQFGILGEPRVNVLELNLALDDAASQH